MNQKTLLPDNRDTMVTTPSNFPVYRLVRLAFVTACVLAATGQLAFSQSPTPTPIPPTFADVPYGSDTQQVLDFWQAKSLKPTPVIFSIHGGGWIHGPKDPLGRDQAYLQRGISVVHITYRFTPSNPLPAPVMDAARALQFVRSKAAEWNIDPKRVVLKGFSAGGCTALWLATHDDLANPSSNDPVERESTRVNGAIVNSAQTTIEPDKVRDWVGEDAINHGMMRSACGFKTNQEMFDSLAKSPEIARIYREFSPINHLTPDDPPILLEYAALTPDRSGGIHGADFGVKFMERAKALGITTCWLKIDKDEQFTGYPGGELRFVQTIFTPPGPGAETPSPATLSN